MDPSRPPKKIGVPADLQNDRAQTGFDFKDLKLLTPRVPAALVLSDVIMPQISGPELIHKIREICPTTAVILMSGHIAEEVLPEDVGFISKPFRTSDLCSVVEKKLMPDVSPEHWGS